MHIMIDIARDMIERYTINCTAIWKSLPCHTQQLIVIDDDYKLPAYIGLYECNEIYK